MIYVIFLYFLNFLISLFYISPDTKPIHRDRYSSKPSESMTDTTTLNHASSLKTWRLLDYNSNKTRSMQTWAINQPLVTMHHSTMQMLACNV